MSALPNAVPQNPACGACGGETVCYDVDDIQCEDCELCFDPNDDLSASFLDPNAEPCGAACDNYWHGDNKIKAGMGFDCGTCKLPTGHTSCVHWTGCTSRPVGVRAEQ